MARGESKAPQGDFGPPIKFDPNFTGPIHRRSCTDIICLVLFLVFIACWIAVSIFAFREGNVRKLLVPTDSMGRKCGLDSGVEDYPHLVFFDMTKCISPEVPINGCPTTQACVKKCPSETLFGRDIKDSDDPSIIRDKLACVPDLKIENIGGLTIAQIKTFMSEGKCARDVFNSKSISLRCIPKDFDELVNITMFASYKMEDAVKIVRDLEDNMSLLTQLNQMGAMVIEDMVSARWWIVLALVIVMFVCIIYITLMRWIAGPIVWFTQLAIIVLLSYSIYLTYDQYAYYRDNPVIISESNTNAGAVAKSITSMKSTWLVLLIAACITLAVVLLMLIFLRKRIVLAIALIKEASRAVGSVKSTLFFPIFPWALEIGVLAFGVAICLYLASIGDNIFKSAQNTNTNACGAACNYTVGQLCEPEKFNEDCKTCSEYICHFVGIVNPQYIYWFQALNVAAFFWAEFFIQGAGDMILAGAFATWYWTYKKSDVPFFTLTKSIGRTLLYNLGTVAFGSLIITICRLIRVLLEYIDAKAKAWDNTFSKVVMCMCKCFFACLESFLKFINKNAYIMCAIHGKAFISSAKDAFSLLMRNIVRVFVLDKVTDFLFFLSKLVVAVGCGAAAYFAFTSSAMRKFSKQDDLHYDIAPALVVAVGAYLIASVFFSVYSMAVDTLFLCFLEDCERNDGSPERRYYMSKQLMGILGKKNKNT